MLTISAKSVISKKAASIFDRHTDQKQNTTFFGQNSGFKCHNDENLIHAHLFNLISPNYCSRQLHILLLGITCLQIVVQQNWLGPPVNDGKIKNVSKCFQVGEKVCIKMLSS